MSVEAQTSSVRVVGSLALSAPQAAIALSIGTVCALAAIALTPPALAAPGALLAYALAWAAVVDADRFILPDAITLSLVLAGLGFAYLRGDAMLPYVIGAAAGYLALALVASTYRHVRGRSGLGMGDAKLLAAAGAWLGWTALPIVMLAASLAALGWAGWRIMQRGRAALTAPIPFGPFIAAAFFACWLLRL